MLKTVETRKLGVKKGMKILVLFIFIFSSVVFTRAEDKRHSWNVVLSGGGFLGHNGDAGTFIQEYDRYYRTLAQAYGTSISGSLNWPGAGMEFGAEIGYSFSSRLSVGVAVERLSKKMEGSFLLGSGMDHYMNGTNHFMDMTLSAVSVSATGRYAVPLTKTVSIVSRAGIGVLFGSLDRVLVRRFPNIGDEWILTGEYTASGLTGQVGLALIWDLMPQIAFQLDGGYRLAALSNWSGKNSRVQGPEFEETSGNLYYLELQGDDRNPTVYHPSLSTGDPALYQDTVSYRACQAGFTGFCLKAGIVVRFGR